jgi:hypothetical protein
MSHTDAVFNAGICILRSRNVSMLRSATTQAACCGWHATTCPQGSTQME